MSEHRLTDEGIRKGKRAVRVRSLAMLIFMECFVGWFGHTKTDSLSLVLIMMFMAALALGIGFNTARKRVAGQLTSYTVTLGSDRVGRVITGMPQVEVARTDVTSIEERRPGGLAVYGRERRNFVGISDDVDGYEAIRAQLAGWHSIEPKPPAKGFATLAVLAATILAFAVTILSHNRIVIAVVGSALAIGLVASCVALWRSPHVDRRTKRLLFIAILPLGAIIVRVVWALAGADFPN